MTKTDKQNKREQIIKSLKRLQYQASRHAGLKNHLLDEVADEIIKEIQYDLEKQYQIGYRDGMNNRERTSQKILDIVSSYQSAKGYPPTLQEIADAYGAKSITTVQRALTNLEKMGLVSRNKYQKRAWHIESIPIIARKEVVNKLLKE